MKFSKNKRGMDVYYYFLILAVIISLITYGTTRAQDKKEIDNYIGEYQFAIMKSADYASNSLLYVEHAAKYALQRSIYDLADKGGIPNDFENECRMFSGAPIWYEVRRTGSSYEEISCFDENKIDDSLIHVFDENLNSGLASNPFGLETDNYEYLVKDNVDVYGLAKRPLNVDIIAKNK